MGKCRLENQPVGSEAGRDDEERVRRIYRVAAGGIPTGKPA
jgi:hypothetical protein